jgi:hypothetical protein
MPTESYASDTQSQVAVHMDRQPVEDQSSSDFSTLSFAFLIVRCPVSNINIECGLESEFA